MWIDQGDAGDVAHSRPRPYLQRVCRCGSSRDRAFEGITPRKQPNPRQRTARQRKSIELPEDLEELRVSMKPPRAYARRILHFFGEIRRSTLLRSSSFEGSARRIHPRPYGLWSSAKADKNTSSLNVRDLPVHTRKSRNGFG